MLSFETATFGPKIEDVDTGSVVYKNGRFGKLTNARMELLKLVFFEVASSEFLCGESRLAGNKTLD